MQDTTLRFKSELALIILTALPQTFELGHLPSLAICSFCFPQRRVGFREFGPQFGAGDSLLVAHDQCRNSKFLQSLSASRLFGNFNSACRIRSRSFSRPGFQGVEGAMG